MDIYALIFLRGSLSRGVLYKKNRPIGIGDGCHPAPK